MHGKNLTEGSVPKQMWQLAWPLMLSVFFYTLYNTVDAFWVGKISPEAIAAVSISQITLFSMVALSMGITVGSGVLMAMSIGARDLEEARRLLGQSFVLAVISGLFFTVFALIFRENLLRIAGATGTILPLAMDYFTITSGGLVLLFILMTIVFVFNSQGDTFTLTKLFAFSTFLNIVMDPLFIFGWNFIPGFGIKGAAIATLLSQIMFIIPGIYVLSRPSMMVQFKFSKLRFKINSVKKVVGIGFPAAITNVMGPLGMAALTAITALSFKEAGAISASIGFRMEFFAFLPAIGYGFASMIMLGQNIGAKKFDRVKLIFQHGLKIGFGLALIIGMVSALFAGPLILVFTSDPLVTTHTKQYLWIVALTYGFLSALIIQAMSFQGIGKSWPGFWIYCIKFLGIAIPLSLISTRIFEYPIYSIWIAIAIGNIVAASVGVFWFKRVLDKILKTA